MRFLLASSFGYGFVTRFENLVGPQQGGQGPAQSLSDDQASVMQPAERCRSWRYRHAWSR
jgi:hypothetical protein